MSIFTSSTSNPKKIKEFEERLKEAAAFHLKYKPKLVDGHVDTCLFCGLATYKWLNVALTCAPVCPGCAEEKASKP